MVVVIFIMESRSNRGSRWSLSHLTKQKLKILGERTESFRSTAHSTAAHQHRQRSERGAVSRVSRRKEKGDFRLLDSQIFKNSVAPHNTSPHHRSPHHRIPEHRTHYIRLAPNNKAASPNLVTSPLGVWRLYRSKLSCPIDMFFRPETYHVTWVISLLI